MATFMDAAAALGRANADLALSFISTAQDTTKRWSELGAKVASEAVSAPVVDKAYWDGIAVVATDIQTKGFNAAQKAVADWQSACTDAWSHLETPAENSAVVALFQPWSPAAAEIRALATVGGDG